MLVLTLNKHKIKGLDFLVRISDFTLAKLSVQSLKERLTHFEAMDQNELEKIEKVDAVLDELTQVMIKNTEELFRRGEKIELLVKKAGDLENMGFETHKMVKTANDKLWWDNMKQRAMIAGGVIVIRFIQKMLTENR